MTPSNAAIWTAFWAVVWLSAGAAAVYVVGGATRDALARSRRRRTERVHRAIADVLLGDDATASAATRRVRGVPARLILEMFAALSLELDGQAMTRLRRLTRATGLDRRIRRQVGHRNWRLRAVAGRLAPLLQDDDVTARLLGDDHPLVRANTAEHLDRDQVVVHASRLLAMLDDESQAVRFAAQQALLAADARIVDPLAEYLANDDHPGLLWGLEVAANLHDPRLLPALSLYVDAEDPNRRRMTAIAAGNLAADADRLLQELLDDSDAEVRAMAVATAGKLRSAAHAAQLGRMLSDRAWLVRREAGGALEAMGPVGAMVLRHHLDDRDPYARDMARLVLDGIAARRGAWSLLPNDLDDLDDWKLKRAPRMAS